MTLASWRRTTDAAWLLVPRLLAGGPLLFFGIMKFTNPGVQENFLATITLAGFPAPQVLRWVAATVEVVGGALLLSGAYARVGALLGVLEMTAALSVHLTFDFSRAPAGGPPHWLPVMVLAGALLVLWRGAGARSADRRWMARTSSVAIGVMALLLPSAMPAQTLDPPGGSLVIVGGAMQDTTILQRFFTLAGGRDAPIVVIPTAGGDGPFAADWSGLAPFREMGATHVTVLHTTDRAVANDERFVAPLRAARAVWFTGGRQWRLADAYLGTRVHEALRDLLRRGGVIGGSSAGATILGSYLVRGDTQGNTTMMGDHQVGFGSLRGAAIDQHLLRRNRQFDLLEVLEAHPDLVGIGLDENTAIVVTGDTFEVIGATYAVLFDPARGIDGSAEAPFAFLAPGDRYNLRTGVATRPGTAESPLVRYLPRSRTP